MDPSLQMEDFGLTPKWQIRPDPNPVLTGVLESLSESISRLGMTPKVGENWARAESLHLSLHLGNKDGHLLSASLVREGYQRSVSGAGAGWSDVIAKGSWAYSDEEELGAVMHDATVTIEGWLQQHR